MARAAATRRSVKFGTVQKLFGAREDQKRGRVLSVVCWLKGGQLQVSIYLFSAYFYVI